MQLRPRRKSPTGQRRSFVRSGATPRPKRMGIGLHPQGWPRLAPPGTWKWACTPRSRLEQVLQAHATWAPHPFAPRHLRPRRGRPRRRKRTRTARAWGRGPRRRSGRAARTPSRTQASSWDALGGHRQGSGTPCPKRVRLGMCSHVFLTCCLKVGRRRGGALSGALCSRPLAAPTQKTNTNRGHFFSTP